MSYLYLALIGGGSVVTIEGFLHLFHRFRKFLPGPPLSLKRKKLLLMTSVT